MTLLLTPLQNAIKRLKEALDASAADPLDSLIRDAVIQRFEFTYEISHQTLRRYLLENANSEEKVRLLVFANLIRTGSEYGLLQGEWADWAEYRKMRGKTSHTYDEVIALEVIAGIPAFLAEAEHLAMTLQARIDAP